MIHEITREKLYELRDLLATLTDSQLSHPLKVLNESTIGMHLRHILEFYQCLFLALDDGNLNYDQRQRDREMERSKTRALACIDNLLAHLEVAGENKQIRLSADFSLNTESKMIAMDTTYFRELHYNVEHCVHHLAIIKIGMRELDPSVVVSSDLGVAASTLRNNNICVR